MITVICGTNRPGSNSEIIAKYYYQQLKKKAKVEVKFLSLDRLNEVSVREGMYEADTQCEVIKDLQSEFMVPAKRFVFVIPEYNGSFPGIFKYFIDAISIGKYKESFSGKHALLVGVATGRAGNLRGMGHLTDILLHIGTHVHPSQMPYSSVGKALKDGKITDADTRKNIRSHIEGWL